VLLGGVDIRRMNVGVMRSNLALVSQEPVRSCTRARQLVRARLRHATATATQVLFNGTQRTKRRHKRRRAQVRERAALSGTPPRLSADLAAEGGASIIATPEYDHLALGGFEVVPVAKAILVCRVEQRLQLPQRAISTMSSAYEMEQTGAPIPTRIPQRVRRSALIRSAAITANASGAPMMPWATLRLSRQRRARRPRPVCVCARTDT
jgi:hypothetical protein